MFETLAPEQRAELLDRLASHGRPSIFDSLTPDQQAELENSIAEAEQGAGVPASQAISRVAAKYGLHKPA